MNSLPTLHSIAAECGVSHVTVWRALKQHPNVDPTTAEKIRKYAQVVGYTSESDARTTATSQRNRKARNQPRTALIPYNKEVLGQRDDDHLFWEYVAGFTEAASVSGTKVQMIGFENSENELPCIQAALTGGGDGILDFGLQPATLEYFIQAGTPVVTLITDWKTTAQDRAHISANHIHGFYAAWMHLRDLGHERVGFLGYQNLLASESRIKECLAAAHLIDDSIDLASIVSVPVEANAAKVWKSLTDALGPWAREKWPTAFFCTNDIAALRVISALQAHGLRVPEDISIMGFDNAPAARASCPGITTIANPRKQIGAAMLHMLENIIAGLPGSRTAAQVISMHLVERQSVAAPLEEIPPLREAGAKAGLSKTH